MAKRLSILILTCIIVSSLLCPSAYALSESTSSNTISIQDANDLYNLSINCESEDYSKGITVSLDSDIYLTSKFTPIPYFSGVFKGNQHTIYGLDISKNTEVSGLFGVVTEEGVITDVKVIGTSVSLSDQGFAGGIAGLNYGTIDNCIFVGSSFSSSNAGGIAGGNASSGIISNCKVAGCVTSYVVSGGIVGNNLGSIKSCDNTSIINAQFIDQYKTLSQFHLPIAPELIKLFTLNQIYSASSVGGIAGINSGTIEECTNEGNVSTKDHGLSIGGIAGINDGYITLCKNTATVYGKNYVGGIVGSAYPHRLSNPSSQSDYEISTKISDYISGMKIIAVSLDQTISTPSAASSDVMSSLPQIEENLKFISNYKFSSKSEEKYSEQISKIRQFSSDTEKIVNNLNSISPSIESSIKDALSGIDIIKNLNQSRTSIYIFPDILSSFSSSILGFGDSSDELNILATELQSLLISLDSKSLAIYKYNDRDFYNASVELLEQLQVLQDKIGILSYSLSDAKKSITYDIHTFSTNSKSLAAEYFETSYNCSNNPNYSNEELLLNNYGIVESCNNQGFIDGVAYVGGIVGAMSEVQSLELSYAGPIKSTTLTSNEYRNCFKLCKNYGNVISEDNYVGGICGYEGIGVISSCQSYGSSVSQSGSYVGGIAGYSNSLILNCFVYNKLFGNDYVGGITGMGNNGENLIDQSIVLSCYSRCTINGNTENSGGVSGSKDGSFLFNYFVSDGQINGLGNESVDYSATPITLGTLEATEGIPEENSWSEDKFSASSALESVASSTGANASIVVGAAAILLFGLIALIAVFIKLFRTMKEARYGEYDIPDSPRAKRKAERERKEEMEREMKAQAKRSSSKSNRENNLHSQQKQNQSFRDGNNYDSYVENYYNGSKKSQSSSLGSKQPWKD